ncbi:regulatory protein RecX [Novosphingobium sp.]|uniref:regulatory protein RecX n=1 Tax=Novosphingobium sp. TaxID=1874826 RepID=UPI003BABF6B3
MAFTSSVRASGRAGGRRQKTPPPPLDQAALDALALTYVARFATSSGRLADYLRRKLRERGWAEESPPDIAALVTRMTERRYVDDAAFSAAKGESLRRRGYGARRIDDTLNHDGIAEPLRAAARGNETERRHAVLAFARRKRFWPYSGEPCLDPAMRRKHLAAYLRAGHGLDHVRRVMDARDLSDLEEWAEEHE